MGDRRLGGTWPGATVGEPVVDQCSWKLGLAAFESPHSYSTRIGYQPDSCEARCARRLPPRFHCGFEDDVNALRYSSPASVRPTQTRTPFGTPQPTWMY